MVTGNLWCKVSHSDARSKEVITIKTKEQTPLLGELDPPAATCKKEPAPKSDKWISDIVGVFCDPIIVMPGGWGETLPDWIKDSITLERLVMNVSPEMTGTDAEACAYLYTASLTAPPSHDWAQIYLYAAGKTIEKGRAGGKMPDDIRVESLTRNQEEDLNRLKAWIYQTRTRARLERDRAERRQGREEEAAMREAAQPALFEF